MRIISYNLHITADDDDDDNDDDDDDDAFKNINWDKQCFSSLYLRLFFWIRIFLTSCYLILKVKYSEDIGISTQKGSRLFIFIGLASSVARLTTGRLCSNKRVNPVYIYQSCMITASLAAFMLPFTTKYWSLIAFSVIYGLSDGVFVTTHCFILLTIVDNKRTTAAFCINNLLYSLSAAAGGSVAGELVLLKTERENLSSGSTGLRCWENVQYFYNPRRIS